MRSTDGGAAQLDAILARAEVLTHEYDDYDAVAARERIARRLTPKQPTSASHWTEGIRAESPAASPKRSPVAPARSPSEHEQAKYELGLVSALVINAPQATASLSQLVDSPHIDPEGALVFACLLHITGRDTAARFWWQFSAGGGSRTAAYCLYLYHRRHGEFRDAEYWRGQSATLAPAPGRRATRRRRDDQSLLPPEVRKDILVQCHHGMPPHLPAALEAVINRLHVDTDDDFGEIPRPSRCLATDLTDGAV